VGARRFLWKLSRYRKLLPAVFLVYSVGCLPDEALRQVLGENMLLTVATAIQTATWVFFNTMFGVI
jgi:hypothetical protein